MDSLRRERARSRDGARTHAHPIKQPRISLPYRLHGGNTRATAAPVGGTSEVVQRAVAVIRLSLELDALYDRTVDWARSYEEATVTRAVDAAGVGDTQLGVEVNPIDA